ncbi:MAG: DUF2281 domain-containing protein [bacterium]
MELQRVWQIFDSLPTHAKQEVIDFMEFLQKCYKRSETPKPPKKSKIIEEAFVGMWTNHDDLKDSTRWTRELRRDEWNN